MLVYSSNDANVSPTIYKSDDTECLQIYSAYKGRFLNVEI